MLVRSLTRYQGITRAAGGCLASWIRPVSAGPSAAACKAADDGRPVVFRIPDTPRHKRSRSRDSSASTLSPQGLFIIVLGSHSAKARFADTSKLAQWAVSGGQLLPSTTASGNAGAAANPG